MTKVIINISMSLDGFSAGAHAGSAHPMGSNGLRLHDWIFDRKTEADAQLMAGFLDRCGAVLLGCQTYRGAIHGAWEGENPFVQPAVVHCRELPPAEDRIAGGFKFITGGIASAVAAARTQAAGRDVWIMGGARTVQRVLEAGLADEMIIHVAPILLGAGQRLFDSSAAMTELVAEEALQTPGATHLRYRFQRPRPAA